MCCVCWEIPAESSGARTLLIDVRSADGGRPMRLYRNDSAIAFKPRVAVTVTLGFDFQLD
jgi:hypothetical protein